MTTFEPRVAIVVMKRKLEKAKSKVGSGKATLDDELASIVAGLNGKSARAIDAARARLMKIRHRRRADLVALLRKPEHSTREHYVSGYGCVKQLVWRALLRPVTPSLLKQIAFVMSDLDDEVRAQFANDLAETGDPVALAIAARAMRDRSQDVQHYLVMGMRDAPRKVGPAYRRAAATLLRKAPRSLHDYHPFHEALERFAPELVPTADSAWDKIWATIDETTKRSRDARSSLQKLQRMPPGHRYAFSLIIVDGEIRNGGVSQLRHNSTWTCIDNAIEGAEAFGRPGLARVLRRVATFYRRRGTTKTTPDALDDAYDRWFRKARLDGMDALIHAAVRKHAALFRTAS